MYELQIYARNLKPCGRRTCMSLLLIIIGCFSLIRIYAIHTMWLLHYMPLFYHEVILGALAFYGLYFGVFKIFLESRNSLSRMFGRAHNVLTLGTLVYMLYDTYNEYYSRFHITVHTYWSPEDFGLKQYEEILSQRIMISYLAILCGVVICVQGFLIYARIVNSEVSLPTIPRKSRASTRSTD